MFTHKNENLSNHEVKFNYVPDYRKFIILAAICNIILRTGRKYAHIQAIFDYVSQSFHSPDKNLHQFTSMNQKDLDFLVENGFLSGSGEFAVTEKGWKFFEEQIIKMSGIEKCFE